MSRTARSTRDDRTLRRAASHRADPSVASHADSAAIPTAAAGEARWTRARAKVSSPDNNAQRPRELLIDLDSAASTPTHASSIASTPSAMSRSGHHTALSALTPLTSSDSSPPGKLPSPHSSKPAYETMHATSASLRAAPPSAPNNGPETITPVNTPPETRISVFPADGVLGQRIIHDPHLDPKLDKKARQSRTPKYNPILDKVCAGYT